MSLLKVKNISLQYKRKMGGGRCLQEANHQDSIARYSISPVKKPIEVDYIP